MYLSKLSLSPPIWLFDPHVVKCNYLYSKTYLSKSENVFFKIELGPSYKLHLENLPFVVICFKSNQQNFSVAINHRPFFFYIRDNLTSCFQPYISPPPINSTDKIIIDVSADIMSILDINEISSIFQVPYIWFSLRFRTHLVVKYFKLLICNKN